MGKFFTALHVKADTKDGFVNAFEQLMKKDGYVPCSEDEAAVSYAATFSEGGWVTLFNGDDSVGELTKLSAKIARDMKTSCFTVEAVDSDFAILELHAPSGGTSRIVVGNGEGYGVEKAPFSADDWRPLLQNGDIEQFLAVIGQNNTFVEDDLAEIGVLLGISSFAMTADYDELSGNESAFSLSFKKTAEKKLTLNAAFKQVFGEALAQLGYQFIKGKYPYLVRVVPGGEIIHVITCEESLCSYPRARRFDVVSGIATVYRYRIDLDSSAKHNTTWLNSIGTFYARTVSKSEYNQKAFESLGGFRYDENDNLSLLNAMDKSLELANKYMLPYLNRAVDLKSSLNCIKVLRQECSTNNFSYPLNFEGCGNHDEGFLYIKTNDEALIEALKRKIDGTILCDEQARQKAIEKYSFFTDPKVLAELERRKKENTEKLREYWLDI